MAEPSGVYGVNQNFVVKFNLFNNGKGVAKNIKVTATELSTGDFVSFILDERGRELLGEICRWEDLVRTEKFYEWVKKYNSDAEAAIKPYHKLRPIPQTHIDRLDPVGPVEEEQNEGYY